ncbi:hypothetical protein O5D80_008669 [Batrachochytrium dendrobatidis]|nr:hypothetical protein O5D80_008669 [Batrachochytrium dendrobatidis]
MADNLPFADSDDLSSDIPSPFNPIPYTLVNSRPLTNTPFVAPYVPVSRLVTSSALYFAGIGPTDILVDLGCGDGRILIDALCDSCTPDNDHIETHQIYPPAQCIGVELDPYLAAFIRKTNPSLISNNKLVIIEQDMFTVDLEAIKATVIVMYLLPAGLEKLKPLLSAWLSRSNVDTSQPTRRIVTIAYSIPGWQPTQVKQSNMSSNSFMGGAATPIHCLFRYEAVSICN